MHTILSMLCVEFSVVLISGCGGRAGAVS